MATLWLRPDSSRVVVRDHLDHVAGSFTAAGWKVHRGAEAPTVDGVLAVMDDPWMEPLPEVLAVLAATPLAGGKPPLWRLPRVLGLAGPQGWHPSRGPYTLPAYRRLARRGLRRRGLAGPTESPLWPGIVAAPAEEAGVLLEAPWPPAPEHLALAPDLAVYRYRDPADHERRELDPLVPGDARLIVDVGCGHGHLGGRLRRTGRRVLGIEPAWDLARRAARRLDLVLAAPAEEALAALAPAVDCFVFADVLEHTNAPERVLRLAAERLAAGGRIVASLPNAAWAPVLRSLAAGAWEPALAGVQARDHLALFTPPSFRRLAAECGLEVETELPQPAPLPWSLRLWAWWAARSSGGDPRHLAAPQWLTVLRRRS